MYKIEIFSNTNELNRISVHYYETKKIYLKWLLKRRGQHPDYFIKGSEMVGEWNEINKMST